MADRPLPKLATRAAWVVFALLSVAMLVGLLRQPVDPSNRALKVPDSVEADRLRRLYEIVPDDPVVLVAFVARGDLQLPAAELTALAALAGRLLELPGVVDCRLQPIDDPGVALMPVSLAADGDSYAAARAVVARAEAESPPSLRVLATGLPLIEGTVAGLVAGERTTIVPLLLFVLFAAAWAFYRRVRLAVAVLLPALTAIAWTGGTVAWLGHRLDPVASLLDPVLLTIGVAASVHFVEAFRRARAAGHAPAHAVLRARALLRRPAFWATTTTMLGLWSLTANDTPAVTDFGLRAALGVSLTHLFTFSLLPAWLAGAAGAVRPAAVGGAGFGEVWLAGLRRYRLTIIAITAALVALAAAGLPRVKNDNDPLNMLPGSERVRSDHETLAARLGAVEVFHLLVPHDSTAVEPSRLLPLLADVRQEPAVAGLGGPVLRGVEGDLAVPLLLTPTGSAAREALFSHIERIARVLGLDGTVAAGPSVQIARDSDRLMRGLLQSLGLSLLLLTAAMAIGLSSLRLAVFAMVPNVLPSLWLYGALGWAGRPVSVATAMIGCTMLGLIVDNTLHLLHHYRDARASLPRGAAARRSLDRCGRAITLSSAVLMLGFLVAASSRLETTVEFALLATATIAMAWFGTAVLLPTLLVSRGEFRAVDEPGEAGEVDRVDAPAASVATTNHAG